MSKTTHIVVHYSATYDDQDFGVADIDRMHRARGWRKVGYHFVIRLDGTVQKGREEWEAGAHVGGQNTGKIGICCIGGLKRATGPKVGVDTRTPAQIEALIALIRDLLTRHQGAQVVGHRDLAPTQCPGFDVIPWWASVEGEARPAPTYVPPDAPARTPGVGEDTVHIVEPGNTLWSIAIQHGMRADELAKLNGLVLDTAVIRPGDVLKLVEPRPKQVNKDMKPIAAPPAPEPEGSGFWSLVVAFFAKLFGGK